MYDEMSPQLTWVDMGWGNILYVGKNLTYILCFSDILKLGHHGSKTSTSELFLDTVQPQYAVVSAAVGNRYGHPHQEVIGRVFARDLTTFHTGIDGSVSFYSDGQRVWKE